tara:strand:+ start:117 stop:413 length:297 start_codon:yes stop_codon:yes gene_type:complete
MVYPTLPVADYGFCVKTSDCKTQVFQCCTATTSASVTQNLCVDPNKKVVPAGITVSADINGTSTPTNFGAATYACKATGAAGLMVAGATAGMTALMLL